MERPFDERDEDGKGEFLQIISASSIQDPDLIPLACKSLPRRCRSRSNSKHMPAPTADYSDLVRDHPDNLLTTTTTTQSSIHLSHNNGEPMTDVVMQSMARIDSLSGHTMTNTESSNMTSSLSDSMSGFVNVGAGDGSSPGGILMLPISSSGTTATAAADLLVTRTSYQTTYQTSPAGSIGFKCQPDLGSGLNVTSLLTAHSPSNTPAFLSDHTIGHPDSTPGLHPAYQRHQLHHHQLGPEEQDSVYYFGDEMGIQFPVKGNQTLVTRGSSGDCHWHQQQQSSVSPPSH